MRGIAPAPLAQVQAVATMAESAATLLAMGHAALMRFLAAERGAHIHGRHDRAQRPGLSNRLNPRLRSLETSLPLCDRPYVDDLFDQVRHDILAQKSRRRFATEGFDVGRGMGKRSAAGTNLANAARGASRTRCKERWARTARACEGEHRQFRGRGRELPERVQGEHRCYYPRACVGNLWPSIRTATAPALAER